MIRGWHGSIETETAMDQVHVPRPWRQLLDVLRASTPGRFYVSGAQDRGKPTLSRALVGGLSRICPTALVDADPGQGELGPPTTMGWVEANRLGKEPAELRFVGATSPGPRVLSSVSALASLVQNAEAAGADWTVIDSCGWVSATEGERFQLRCLDALRPDHIVVLQQAGELEALVRKIGRRFLGHIHPLEPSSEARLRSPAERQSRREARFREWIAQASELELQLDGLEWKGPGGELPPADLQNRLVAACGRASQVCALGIIQGMEPGRLHILGRTLHAGPIRSIQLGEHRVDREGRHDRA
jgi:polynucleotide 5'-kinase involved in rRNA processing